MSNTEEKDHLAPGARDGENSIPYDEEARNEPEPAQKPSQAEGDRETVDASIRQKERDGEL
jgi:hypothetical protein